MVRSRHHGSTRAYFYACSSYYHKGKSVCPNSLETPMLSASQIPSAAVTNSRFLLLSIAHQALGLLDCIARCNDPWQVRSIRGVVSISTFDDDAVGSGMDSPDARNSSRYKR